MHDVRRRLAFHGALLLLAGMLTGLVETQFSNVRMGLAAHLEGVMNGILLLALAAAWGHVRLGARASAAALLALLYGTWVNWFCVTLAASWGTTALSPIASAGRAPAAGWQEQVVLCGLISVALAMLSGVGLVAWGLRRGITGHDVRSSAGGRPD